MSAPRAHLWHSDSGLVPWLTPPQCFALSGPSSLCWALRTHFLLQLREKRCLALKKKGVERTGLYPGSPQNPANASVLTVCQGAQRDDCGAQKGASTQTASSRMASLDQQCLGGTSTEVWGPKPATLHPSNQSSPSLVDSGSTGFPCGRGAHNQSPGSRCAGILRGTSAMEDPQGPLGKTMEDKEELHSLSSLLSSQYRLVPWRLSPQTCPCADLPDFASIPKPCPKMRGPSPDPLPIGKSKKGAIFGGLVPTAKKPNLEPGFGESEEPLSALELAHLSQTQKRNHETLGTRKRKRKKRH